jgi:uncharacterized protein YceH (UPF0502 family)
VTAQRIGAVEQRVLGCLIEKQRTTPEQYPLTLNSLRLACNQSTNRDPVVDYDEAEIREAVQHLGRIGWTRLATGPTSRVAKYRHLFDEALTLDHAETVILALLMLRGPQTAAELKTRAERLRPFADVAEVTATLGRLAERELALLLPRRPGQREERWMHLLGEDEPDEGRSGAGAEQRSEDEPPSGLEQRLARVEEKLEELSRALDERGLLDS